MDDHLLLDIVLKYIDAQEKRNGRPFSKVQRNDWIIGDVIDELQLINEEFRNIKDDDVDAKTIFCDTIIGQFKTKEFKRFLKNKSKSNSDYYKNLLKTCIIGKDTIEDFLLNRRDNNAGTIDFFIAFYKHQQKEDEQEGIPYQILLPKRKQTINLDSKTLDIRGALIINEEFINEVKAQNRKFGMFDFYTSKKNGSQWYGVINNYDIVRRGYAELRSIVINGFKQDRYFKISAVVYGAGGSGKSTILRRLSVDIQEDKHIKVVWLNDGYAEEFIKQGFPIIKKEIENDQNKRVLIIIDDWYRMFNNKPEIANKILEEIHNTNHIQIVIGDRNIADKPYEKYGTDCELLLSVDENKQIIDQIVTKFPDWKLASEKLFKKEESYQSTLFLLLFILARMSNDTFDITSYNLSDPQIIFRNIIKSDVKFIENRYKGLAKAMYYWACMYAEHKIFITYNTFLQLADYYNGNEDISKDFSRWNAKNPTMDRLKIYINKSSETGGLCEDDILEFSHDILVEEGLSKLRWSDWIEFSGSVKIQMTEVIVQMGDDYSASKILETMFSKKEQYVFEDKEDRLNFLKQFLKKDSPNLYHIIKELIRLRVDDWELQECAELLCENQIDSVVFWSEYFRKAKNSSTIKSKLTQILNIESVPKYDFGFIVIVLEYCDNSNIRNAFVENILNSKSFENIDPRIIIACLSYSTNEAKQKFFNEHLLGNNWENIFRFSIYTNSCLKYASDETRIEFSTKILKRDDWKAINFLVVCKCIEYAPNEIVLDFSKKVLLDENWSGTFQISTISYYCLRHTTDDIKESFFRVFQQNNQYENLFSSVKNCLQYAPDKIRHEFSAKVLADNGWEKKANFSKIVAMHNASYEVGQDLCRKVLENIDLENIDSYLVTECLKYTSDKIRQYFCGNFLTRADWQTSNALIQEYFKYEKDKPKQKFSLKILSSNWYYYSEEVIYRCLKCFENEKSIPDVVNNVIEYIIDKSEDLNMVEYYMKLLKVNFLQHPIWREKTEKVLQSWENWTRVENWENYEEGQGCFASVLHAYRLYPDAIYDICLNILVRWRQEFHPVIYFYYSQLYFGNHFKIALAHPHLRLQAKQTAIEILQLQKEKITTFKNFEKEIIEIAENNVYPQWDV